MKIDDLKHMRVPERKRGALWWLQERELAERAVTLADALQDSARNDYTRYLARKLLDERLDYLASVDDLCEAILRELALTDPATADAASRHYLKRESVTSIAEGRGTDVRELRGRMYGKLLRFRPSVALDASRSRTAPP